MKCCYLLSLNILKLPFSALTTRPTTTSVCLTSLAKPDTMIRSGLFSPVPNLLQTLFCQVLYNQAFSSFSTAFIQPQMLVYLHIPKSILKTLSNERTESRVPDDHLIHAGTAPPLMFGLGFFLYHTSS